MKWSWLVFLLTSPLWSMHAQNHAFPGHLQLTFGSIGLSQIQYDSRVIEDTNRWPEDIFHIWHLKTVDSHGRILVGGGNAWGENCTSKSWNASTKTWAYEFTWGQIKTTYEQHGDDLILHITLNNKINSGLILDGASLFPLTLHLPGNLAVSDIQNGIDQPGNVSRNWDGGVVAVLNPGGTKPTYTGFQATPNGGLAVLASGTKPDALPGSADRGGQVLAPGKSQTVSVVVRFGPLDANLHENADRDWVSHWPQVLEWQDRSVIGSVFLADSGSGDKTHPAGFLNNPRRYFKDAALNVRRPEGLRDFQERILKQARTVVANLKKLHAQGVITWDLEGEEFPQDTTYLCAPNQIAQLAPEMESTLANDGRYAGKKLDDAYFKTLTDAGYRVGVCIRPQRLVLNANGTAEQTFLNDADATKELIAKIKYTHDRWGATLFYVDSMVRQDGSTIPSEVLEAAARAAPDSLLIPEQSTLRMYRASAPFASFLFHGDLGIDRTVLTLYPHAFRVNMVNDVKTDSLIAHRRELTDAVRRGDVLMVHADYWHPNDDVVLSIYHDAWHPSSPRRGSK